MTDILIRDVPTVRVDDSLLPRNSDLCLECDLDVWHTRVVITCLTSPELGTITTMSLSAGLSTAMKDCERQHCQWPFGKAENCPTGRSSQVQRCNDEAVESNSRDRGESLAADAWTDQRT